MKEGHTMKGVTQIQIDPLTGRVASGRFAGRLASRFAGRRTGIEVGAAAGTAVLFDSRRFRVVSDPNNFHRPANAVVAVQHGWIVPT
jgi:hypothetical protein